MGQGPEPVAVADSGPLIHLHEIGRLSLLAVFSSISIPHAVWEESVTSGRVPARELEAAVAVQLHQVSPEQAAQTTAVAGASGLHAGELEALALCQALNVRLMLTDDLAARDAAKLLGVRPVGSLGVVVRAYHQNQITLADAEGAIEKLYSVSTLFVTRAIADLAIEHLRPPST